ncbi:mannosidase, endo-alpha [Reticulomyxa filosa]|uniref:Mannosidase, endo-alpha n=1 Tax=Reticulomyxa filosa TaxID=46433 RepID=X6MGF7_RETFI|nr:mannosidase, endo-alpha [Reticulomyxa filosa]|eukprot:ETO12492.1 mannosidase, endo-alpha [Reticulomyxa filosa]
MFPSLNKKVPFWKLLERRIGRRLTLHKGHIITVGIIFLVVVFLLWRQLPKANNADKALNANEDKRSEALAEKKAILPNKVQQEQEQKSKSNELKPSKETKIRDQKQILESMGQVHIFYYPWYGNIETDKEWVHWNHDILPHWSEMENAKYEIGKEFEPCEDIGSVFYPSLKCYSSRDAQVITTHAFDHLANRANVNVLIVSWHSPLVDQKNMYKKDTITSDNLKKLFEVISEANANLMKSNHTNTDGLVKIGIHLEPYDHRTAESTVKDIQYLFDQFGGEAYANTFANLFYVYDSYKMANAEWRRMFAQIRNTKYDGIFLGLYLDDTSEKHILESGFDGFYTYFGSQLFTKGSNFHNWDQLNAFAYKHNLIFVPSVSPGYDDTRIRPWNAMNTQPRKNGAYYKDYWNAIFKINALTPHQPIRFVSITSFNEWHEGTQIEPSISYTSTKTKFTYHDYRNEGGEFAYLQITKDCVAEFYKIFAIMIFIFFWTLIFWQVILTTDKIKLYVLQLFLFIIDVILTQQLSIKHIFDISLLKKGCST